MNERIKELMDEAVRFRLDPDSNAYEAQVSPEDLEFFAELIVRECIAQASISNGHGNNQWDKALTFAADNIKKHFGVEE